MQEPTGYQIADIGLLLSPTPLTWDEQVRIYSFLIPRIPDLISVPPTVRFRVIAIEYLGGPYPGIGIYSEGEAIDDQVLSRFSFKLEDELAAYVAKRGLPQLLLDAAGETLTWHEVLRRVGRQTHEADFRGLQ